MTRGDPVGRAGSRIFCPSQDTEAAHLKMVEWNMQICTGGDTVPLFEAEDRMKGVLMRSGRDLLFGLWLSS